MPTTDKTPTFNLKVVLKETGLKPDTLRAWERRHGLPQPQRSAGGHRLYSQRDIEIVKWLVARQQEGLSISRAVNLWRNLVAGGQDPLRMPEFARPPAPTVAITLAEGQEIGELRQAWLAACLAYDERAAEHILTQAFALYPAETVCLEFLQKGLADLGEGWYQGEITVQQEHFASELTVRRLETLLAATPSPTRSKRILTGCPPDEEHTFSPLLLTLFLRRRGWDALFLGANVPSERLKHAIKTADPHLMILSAQQLHTAATMLEIARSLHEQKITLAYGGLVFNLLPAVRSRILGHFLGERLDQAPQAVEQVLSSPPPLPPVEAISQAYQQALPHYRERQGLIESEVWQAMEPVGVDYGHMSTASAHFGLNIISALKLGDMELLGSEIEWVEGLLRNFRLPARLLRHYLRLYYQAASTHLDERGAPVTAWLERVTQAGGEL